MPKMFTTNNPDVVFGIAEVKADGETIAQISDVSFKPAGIQFEDDNNGTCFVPSRTGAVLKAKSRLVKGQSLATVNKKYDVTIMITANTGQVWMMPHAVKTAPSEMGASTGGYDIEFHSSESEEVSHG